MRILIASGIYPPDIGGPAQYARNLYETWKKEGHDVKVAAYRWERAFPPLVRHILFFLKIIRKGWKADLILVLDTWSAAVPTMYACRLMNKKYIIRTGGDFLWETYVERTGDLVLFRDFYSASLNKLSRKEKLIFKLGGESLRKANAIIFSTEWQKEIFEKAYLLNSARCYIVENYCGERKEPVESENRLFVAGSRFVKLKNMDLLKSAFEEARIEVKKRGFEDIELDCGKAIYDSFVEKIHQAYAVIIASISDISPNIVADAISVGTPFIVTKETGMTDQIKKAGLLIDPLDKKDIVDKIVWISDPVNRKQMAEKVRGLSFVHTWKDVADEILKIWNKT
ncbi:MAG: glycosyltransferase family 4 protein [bacterium]|nr:glycosyltransferase family 4 protein [bacterium]